MIKSFKLPYNQNIDDYLAKNFPKISKYRILTKSLDARKAQRGKKPEYHYQIEFTEGDSDFEKGSYSFDFKKVNNTGAKPIIVGCGPAGIFAALRLLDHGIPSILIDRGESAKARMRSIARFWRYGELNEDSNVCYGEGGAGLFSDGKLITRIKSPHTQYVLQRLVDFGAPEEILYQKNPHLGSNKIRSLISQLTHYMEEKGVEIRYETKVTEVLFESTSKETKSVCGVRLENGDTIKSNKVVLAIGHSARDLISSLYSQGIEMKSKDYAVGVRIEHPRRLIDQCQYGDFSKDPLLGAARYRLSYENKDTKRGTYSFCMCPGGYVLSSGTKKNGHVVNGMSNSSCSSPWTNSAIVVSVKSGVDFKEGPLESIKFQEDIEKAAYNYSSKVSSGKEIMSQGMTDFMKNKVNSKLPRTSCPSGIVAGDLREIFPPTVTDSLNEAFEFFNTKLKGFYSKESLLLAPETRTSSPVSFMRDSETLQSVSAEGLFPIGEGAGHAGGITSAAVDGVKCALAMVEAHL
jgi:uncharacterized protein